MLTAADSALGPASLPSETSAKTFFLEALGALAWFALDLKFPRCGYYSLKPFPRPLTALKQRRYSVDSTLVVNTQHDVSTAGVDEMRRALFQVCHEDCFHRQIEHRSYQSIPTLPQGGPNNSNSVQSSLFMYSPKVKDRSAYLFESSASVSV
jgi:hypothetical protein